MKKTKRQVQIEVELILYRGMQLAAEGEAFTLRTPSKRQRRLLREFWAIERQKKGAAVEW